MAAIQALQAEPLLVVAVQGLTTPVVEPITSAYRQLLWFSLPLGVLALGLLVGRNRFSR